MRLSRLLLLVPLSVIAALLAVVPAAQAAGTGQITGTLLAKPTGGTAAPYPSGGVQLYYNEIDESFGSKVVDVSPTFDADGDFTFTGLEDGFYWLQAWGGDYASEWYHSRLFQSDASSIEITGGDAKTLVHDVVLEEPGGIVGRVVDESGAPIAGANVSFRATELGGGSGVTTDANGEYDTRAATYYRDIVAGSYLVDAGLFGAIGQPVYATGSDTVTVAPGQDARVDFVLTERPTATFTVLDPSGQPLADAPLIIWHRDAEWTGGEWQLIQSGPHQTDAQGRYRFVDGVDEVRFQVQPPEGYAGSAVAEWWDDAATLEQARSLTFPDGVEVSRDITMQLDAPTVPAGPVAPAPATLKSAKPKLAGKARVGRVLKARTGSWGPGPVTLTYTWFRGTKAIPKATKASYRLTKKDLRKKISVRVTGTAPGYASVTVKSAKTAKVKR